MSIAAAFTSQLELIPSAPPSSAKTAAQNFTRGCKSSTALENKAEMVCKFSFEKRTSFTLVIVDTPNFPVELSGFK